MKKSILTAIVSVFAIFLLSGTVLAKKVKLEGKININTASALQLRLLPRVGPKLAQRIIAYRKKKKFARPSEIMKVKGIGYKTFLKLKNLITVNEPTKIRVHRK